MEASSKTHLFEAVCPVIDFTQVFSNYLQLQNLVLDNSYGNGDKSMQDIFLSRLSYRYWITKHTYYQQATKGHFYTAELFYGHYCNISQLQIVFTNVR